MDSTGLILYEFPCNEKIRMYLRLETLFQRFEWFCSEESPYAHHAALSALFDLADATARSDLRNELLQELARQRQTLLRLRGRNDVNQTALKEALDEIAATVGDTSRIVGRSGQTIRENEWLQLVRTRQSIPGGTCEFDMPMLHWWLSMPPAHRQAELQSWAASLETTKRAVKLVLRHIRASMAEKACHADHGMYQLPMSGKAYTLARIWMDANDTLIPEVSANKYMLWIRFSRPDERRRLHAVQESVDFKLGLCG